MPSVPEISVVSLAEKLSSQDKFILLDVRESWELNRAKIGDARLAIAPTSRLGNEGLAALPEPVRSQDTEIYVMCHHGVRSASVADWLVSQGRKNVFNVAGGIDEYARRVDPLVGMY